VKRFSILGVLFLLVTLAGLRILAAEETLRPGDYVAVIGDSITEQRLYSRDIEEYLLMCKPAANLRVTQFGWCGETAPGFAVHMANEILSFPATVATTCFGMNDGGYSPMDPGKKRSYYDGQKSIIAQLKKAGVERIVVGSPGCVDTDTFGNHSPERAAMYNKALSQLRDVARQVAEEERVVYADVFDPMMAAMTKAKAKYGREYHLAGGDGIHPDRNGHLVMAYVFLKALGCDGQIGRITFDLAQNRAEATEGHKVRSCAGGQVEIESTKYPFCFYGDPAQPGATRGVIEFIPFNDELNRFQLVVRGIGAEKAQVTWGNATKEFTADKLAKGINLAAEFLDNPFSEPFRKVEEQISRQQQMEVRLVMDLMYNLFSEYGRLVPDEQEAIQRIGVGLVKQDQAAQVASTAAVVPVKHTIKVKPIN
jgi:lysophospholipase L1-like esterase